MSAPVTTAGAGAALTQPTGCGAVSATTDAADTRPILIVPYFWIGDYVRVHTAVKLLNARFPARPVDMLTTALTAPLADYMSGLRKAIPCDFPHGALALGARRDVARRLRAEGYGSAIVMPRTLKAALAPWLAGIPERTGFFGEGRFALINDVRRGERKHTRMVDRMVALTQPIGAPLPASYPQPSLAVSADAAAAWRARRELGDDRPGRRASAPPRSARDAAGRSPTMPSSRGGSRRTAPASGCWAARTIGRWR